MSFAAARSAARVRRERWRDGSSPGRDRRRCRPSPARSDVRDALNPFWWLTMYELASILLYANLLDRYLINAVDPKRVFRENARVRGKGTFAGQLPTSSSAASPPQLSEGMGLSRRKINGLVSR